MSFNEVTEMLVGVGDRHAVMHVDPPLSVTVDNCCSIRNQILAAFPHIKVYLDTYHFKERYDKELFKLTFAILTRSLRFRLAITGELRKQYARQILSEVTMCILERTANYKGNGLPAVYRTKEEQLTRLEALFLKYQRLGVWSSAAQRVSPVVWRLMN